MSVKYPKVAVLLAAYNGVLWIEEQLCSIFSQSNVNVTVYISVDRSDDGTQEWCAAYAAENGSVVLLPAAGRFGGASRNFFRLIRDVDFEGFDFVAFADQDDVWYPFKLEVAVQAIQLRNVDAYSSNVLAFWPDGRAALLGKAQPQVKWDFLFEAAGPGCTYVMNRPLADSIKQAVITHWHQLQQVSLHDWYCYAFARSNGYRWYIDPQPTMDYRQHENNQVGANKGIRSLISRYRSIRDGWWFSQVQLIACLVDREGDSFVKSWLALRRVQVLKLAFSARQCRRRRRDKILFFCLCWLTAIVGAKTK